MVDTVITLGKQHLSANFRSIDDTPNGDVREVSFRCNFSDDAVNSGAIPAPPPSIRVQWWGTVSPLDLRVELIPPGLSPEMLVARTQRTLVPWASEPTGDETNARPRPSRGRATRRLVQDDPFEHDWFEDGELAPIDPGDDLPPGGGGGGGQSYTRIIDPATDPVGTWKLRVRYFGVENADLHFTVEHPHTIQVIEETRIPFQLINRAFRQAMLALQLRLKVDNGQARISFDAGFKALTGIDDLIYNVSDRLQDINLEEYNVEMGNDNGTPAIYAGFDLEERGDEIGIGGPDANIANMAVCLRLGLHYGYSPGPDFFATAMMFDKLQILHPAIYVSPQLDAHPEIRSMWMPFANAILGITGCLGLTSSSVEEYVQDAISDTESALLGPIQHASKYIYDTIMHLAKRSHVMHELRADDDAIIVKHHRKPNIRDVVDLNATGPADGSEVAPSSPSVELSDDTNARAAAVEESDDAASEIAPSSASAENQSAVPHQEGHLSAPALVSSRGHTQHVGEQRIDHIVFLMMENRSFDHMLGYRGFGSTVVNGLTGAESNMLTADVPPFPVFHYTKTYGIPSPAHGNEATLEQIAGGTMSGFVKNYAKRNPLNDLRLVMSYYTADELPMYDFLADNFAICDNWHSSHPGETQCNRFCAITGKTPELDNFEITDPQIAYYRATTVFDVLTESNVDWAYVEGNVGFIRIFDQYRLDTQRVIPYQDRFTSDTFVERVRGGRLPAVTFIDPNFIDIPPAWDANDDLPPADVCRGQELVRGVYELLSRASTWDHTLLVITYDEHGGFFDHSVPAGMPGSAHPTPFPLVHPEGATHLGVRVPTFVVSPWIDAGTVIKTVFDHTSIIRTIIERFAPPQFPITDVFGERAATANELLSELKRTTARKDKPTTPEIVCHSRTSPAGPTAQLDGTDFVTSMRLLGLPPLHRGRLVT